MTDIPSIPCYYIETDCVQDISTSSALSVSWLVGSPGTSCTTELGSTTSNDTTDD